MKKVWVCKTFYVEGSPNEFSIAHVFDSEQKAVDWKANSPYCAEYDEMDVE